MNTILKNLYETNFFKNVNVEFKNNILLIKILENPIIETINYNGIKSNKLIDQLKVDALLKSRSSYNEFILIEEKKRLISLLKEIGYYNPKIDIILNEENDNLVILNLNFDLGNKAKIKKITFIGDKIFKDKKLRRIIASTEYKYWKFLSGRKFLNEQLVEFDKRLLTNFYKNNGFYNAKVNTSFAKLLNKDEFELIFNIDAKSKVFFGDLTLNLPSDFDENNFLTFKTRRNRKISLTEYYDLVYEYKSDCLTAGIKYKKSYYQDGDIKPTEDLLFTISLFPLTTYEHNAKDLVN